MTTLNFQHQDDNNWLMIEVGGQKNPQYPSPLEVKMLVEEAVKNAYEAGRAYEAQQCRGSAADNHPNAPYDLPELHPWKDSFERLTTITPNHQD